MMMEIRFQNSPKETGKMDTQELRTNFLIEKLMVDDGLKMFYSHYDRVIIGGAKPVNQTLKLENHPELRAEYFLERREIGIINVGGTGKVEADGVTFDLEKLTCLYLGKGTKNVVFSSLDSNNPAVFYLLSAPAHQTYPAQKMTKDEASPGKTGSQETANERTIYRYVHLEGIKSCQLVMGLTILNTGSVWNTMPAHTHTRRMEAYFYFDLLDEHRVLHLMGEPQESRHLIVANQEAVISPPWSVHAGCGTASYGFIWGMAGENLVYSDMDPVAIGELK